MAVKILVVGAGGVGGYFGGRLAEAGRDVTFLVRETQAERIRENGLKIVSPHGDATLQPRVLLAHEIAGAYDLVLLSVKAYGLESAMNDFSAAVGPSTIVLPMLNGMRHVQILAQRFGEEAVIGGLCFISSEIDQQGRIVQLSPMQRVVYGERMGGVSGRIKTLDATLRGAGFEVEMSEDILQAMWEKWVLLASLGTLTCLLKGNVGEIVAVEGGVDLAYQILTECSKVATACGFAPRPAMLDQARSGITAKGSLQTSSMYRDLSRGGPVEVDQILGDLLARGQKAGVATPLLQAAFVNLKIYETQRSYS